MKERKFFNRIRIVLFNQLKKVTSVAIAIAIYLVGYLISWNFLQIPLNDTQFELCEQLAIDMSENIPNLIGSSTFCIQVTDDFYAYVNMSSRSIKVFSAHPFHYGKVVAKLKGGKPIPKREMQYAKRILISSIIGLILFLIYDAVISTIKLHIKKS